MLAQTRLKKCFLPVKAYFILGTDRKYSEKKCVLLIEFRVDIHSDLNEVAAQLRSGCTAVITLCHSSWTGSHHGERDWGDKACLVSPAKLLMVEFASPRGEVSSSGTPASGLSRKVGLRLMLCHQQSSTEFC